MYNPYAELEHMHHAARWFPGLERWIINNRDHESVAIVATGTIDHVTKLTIALTLGQYKRRLLLDPIVRPGGMRTALRWICQELNNGHLWLSTRLSLEREARLLGYDEPEILACEHAYDYQYCLQLVSNLPGLLNTD